MYQNNILYNSQLSFILYNTYTVSIYSVIRLKAESLKKNNIAYFYLVYTDIKIVRKFSINVQFIFMIIKELISF